MEFIVKIREFTLVMIFAIHPKNGKFRFKTKIMKFLGIQPKYKLYWNYKKAEELEWTRNKIRDSGTLVTHLESVKDRFWKK